MGICASAPGPSICTLCPQSHTDSIRLSGHPGPPVSTPSPSPRRAPRPWSVSSEGAAQDRETGAPGTGLLQECGPRATGVRRGSQAGMEVSEGKAARGRQRGPELTRLPELPSWALGALEASLREAASSMARNLSTGPWGICPWLHVPRCRGAERPGWIPAPAQQGLPGPWPSGREQQGPGPLTTE